MRNENRYKHFFSFPYLCGYKSIVASIVHSYRTSNPVNLVGRRRFGSIYLHVLHYTIVVSAEPARGDLLSVMNKLSCARSCWRIFDNLRYNCLKIHVYITDCYDLRIVWSKLVMEPELSSRYKNCLVTSSQIFL